MRDQRFRNAKRWKFRFISVAIPVPAGTCPLTNLLVKKIIVHQVHQVADLKIDMNESGEKDFQKTFKEYLERKGPPNLLADFPHLFC